tara:strand:- start:273 stop:461 length:189 start_codon:yes stop_codon:yes gene_type:complete
MNKELQDIKGNDKIRLEYIYQCQIIINLINKNIGVNTMPKDLRKTIQYYRLEIEKNLNHIGR